MGFELNQIVTYQNKLYAVHADMDIYVWLINEQGKLIMVSAWEKQKIEISNTKADFKHENGFMIPIFNSTERV